MTSTPPPLSHDAHAKDSQREQSHHTQPQRKDRSTIISSDGKTAARWSLRFILIVAALALLGKILSYAWVILLPIIMAIIVSTVLWPSTRFLRNHRFPPALAALTSILGFIVIIGAVFAGMAPVLANQGGDLIDKATVGVSQIANWLQSNPYGFNSSSFSLDEVMQDSIDFLRKQSQNIVNGVSAGVSAATSFAVAAFVTLIVTFFMLKDGSGFLPMLRRYTGQTAGWHLTEVLTRSWNTLGGYVRTQALIALIDAVFIGLGLWIIGVPMAFVLAVITFFGGFIPIVGAISAGALAVIIALVTNGFTDAVLSLILIIAMHQLEGNFVSPILQSKAMNLHAAVVLLSVTLGSTLFGIVGAFLAVPVAAVLAVWIRYHAEMVSLRAGEITVDDITYATAQAKSPTSQESFQALRTLFSRIALRSPKPGSTADSDADAACEDAAQTINRSKEK